MLKTEFHPQKFQVTEVLFTRIINYGFCFFFRIWTVVDLADGQHCVGAGFDYTIQLILVILFGNR